MRRKKNLSDGTGEKESLFDSTRFSNSSLSLNRGIHPSVHMCIRGGLVSISVRHYGCREKKARVTRQSDERSLSDLIQRRTMTSASSASTQIRGQEFAIGNRFVNLKYLASGTYGMVV